MDATSPPSFHAPSASSRHDLQVVDSLLRGMALFLSLFSLLNLVASWRDPGFDPNLWWINLFLLPPPLQGVVMVAAAGVFFLYAIQPAMRPPRRWATLAVLSLLEVQALANAGAYYALLWRGTISSSCPFPFSAVVALMLAALGISAWRSSRPQARPHGRSWGLIFAGALLTAGCFPLLQAFFYGKTDYRRPADAILVFGARTFADGRPSEALADRVRTGAELYRQRLAPRLILSGGPGEGAVHETQAMCTLAIDLGVPPDAIELDPAGVNTEASVVNVQRLGQQQHLIRILAVSHYWHLPRIKLAAGRRATTFFTVPAHQLRPLANTPYMLLRETAAFWAYYARLICGTPPA